MFLTKKELPGQSHKVNCTAKSTPDLSTLILLSTCTLILGRTLDFAVDMRTVPIVGSNFINTDIHGPVNVHPATQEVPTSPTRKSPGDGESCWRKSQSSQVWDHTV